MIFSLYLLAAISLLTTVLFVLLLKEFSIRSGTLLVRGVPLVGGISMAMGFSGAMLMFLTGSFPRVVLGLEFYGIIVASIVQLAAGTLDDMRELTVLQKFMVQILSAFVLVFSGVKTDIVFLGDGLNFFVSFLWIVGITNAVNLLDVMDGLAAAISLPILFCFVVIAGFNHDMTTLVLTVTLAGAILGFSFFNFPPAKVYMGNSGSHFLGLLLAAIALTTHYAGPGKEMALLAPFLILGFPLFDTVFLVLMRLKKGRSAFCKSDDHLVLRYLKLGHSKKAALMFMVLFSVFYVGSGFLLMWVSQVIAAGILTVVTVVSVFLIRNMSRVDVLK